MAASSVAEHGTCLHVGQAGVLVSLTVCHRGLGSDPIRCCQWAAKTCTQRKCKDHCKDITCKRHYPLSDGHNTLIRTSLFANPRPHMYSFVSACWGPPVSQYSRQDAAQRHQEHSQERQRHSQVGEDAPEHPAAVSVYNMYVRCGAAV